MPHGHGAEPKSHVDKRNGPPIEIGRLIGCQKSRLFTLMSRHFYEFVLVLVSLVSCFFLPWSMHKVLGNDYSGRKCSRYVRSGVKKKGWTGSKLRIPLPLSSVLIPWLGEPKLRDSYTALQHRQIRCWLFLGLYKHLSRVSQVVLPQDSEALGSYECR